MGSKTIKQLISKDLEGIYQSLLMCKLHIIIYE